MAELEIEQIGVLKTDKGEIPVCSIGEPDPVDYIGFDVLYGATVLASEGNRIDIEKDGKKKTYYLGECNDLLFLSGSQTDIKVRGYLLQEHLSQKNPFSDMVDQKIEKIGKSYLSPVDESKDLPWEVILKTSDGAGYQIVEDDGEIIVYKAPFEYFMNQKLSHFISRC